MAGGGGGGTQALHQPSRDLGSHTPLWPVAQGTLSNLSEPFLPRESVGVLLHPFTGHAQTRDSSPSLEPATGM